MTARGKMRVRRETQGAAAALSPTVHSSQILGDCIQALEQVPACKAEGVVTAHFEHREQRLLWDELCRQHEAGLESADLYALQVVLRERGMDAFESAAFISRLEYWPAESRHAGYHARALVTQRTREEVAAHAKALAAAMMVGDTDAGQEARLRMAEAQERLDRLGKPVSSGRDLVAQVVDAVRNPLEVRRVQTGLKRLDDHLGGGFGPGWLVIVLASAKAGKSSLAINNFARCALRSQGMRVLVVSQEMSGPEIVQRWIAAETSIPVRLLATGQLTDEMWSRLYEAEQEVGSWRFLIGGPVSGVDELCARAEHEHRNGGLDLVVAENLQLIDNGLENRVEDLSLTTRRLKLLAAKLQIPVVLCSQPTNDAAKNKSQLGFFDGKGSGSIAADCDLMLVPSREEAPNSHRAGLAIVGGRHVEPVRWESGSLRFLGARMTFEEA